MTTINLTEQNISSILCQLVEMEVSIYNSIRYNTSCVNYIQLVRKASEFIKYLRLATNDDVITCGHIIPEYKIDEIIRFINNNKSYTINCNNC